MDGASSDAGAGGGVAGVLREAGLEAREKTWWRQTFGPKNFRANGLTSTAFRIFSPSASIVWGRKGGPWAFGKGSGSRS